MIHTVGPVWGGGERGEDGLLASCYRNSLCLACDHGLASIAYPAISTGAYGFPPERAALIAVRTVAAALADKTFDRPRRLLLLRRASRRHHEAALAAAQSD